MSSATPRRHLSKDDKLAIIEASKSPGFSKEVGPIVRTPVKRQRSDLSAAIPKFKRYYILKNC